MTAYGYALGEEAVHTFTNRPPRQREKLLRFFTAMTQKPHRPGDFQETGTSGRAFEVGLFDDLLITWWVDHATREVRIIRIESAE